MTQNLRTTNDTRTKGHMHKLLLTDWEAVRDRGTWPGENKDRYLINSAGTLMVCKGNSED